MKPIILAILDGWGIGDPNQANAIYNARTPNLKSLEKNYPHCSLQSSGEVVGLPWKETGNSEVGHLTVGSGRIIYQYLPRISKDIENNRFFENPAFLKIIAHVNKNNSTLHLIGLLSSGNAHSYLQHIYALLNLAEQNKIQNLRLHIFTDGKDAPLKEGVKIISELQKKLINPNWKIASIVGRFYAMDRNNNWDRTEIAYNLIANNVGEKTQNPIEKIQELYDSDITDTYIKPLVITDKSLNPIGGVNDNDGIIFWDFREDSARQLSNSFIQKDFNKFPRKNINNLEICTMTQYEKKSTAETAYPPTEIKNHLTEILDHYNKKILKIAETEKYAHVTYFFNGGQETPYPNETRKLIPSKIISHYDDSPEMQAEKITETIIDNAKKKYDLIIANYSNADMIGHTGNLDAGIKAIGAVDKAIKPLIDLAEKGDCILIITSDHGNAEEMMDIKTGEIKTEHTLNPVPFYLINREFQQKNADEKYSFNVPQGILSDIAPTILEILKIPQPSEMTGMSLLEVLK
ncbi:MAG TPA: 2,3-bisphosphoglycerate-independent phosphoglycerate mutase [Candidatus Portnoybacteria bacterium]|jgi:2,3-bisphosphoglycerate-independent phosphoglycerate mutase|nr:2,3-bisphosphoglycerate-independent phosphoglycerate mutase [Candidatus Portnoybacteria bacterium]HOZ16663.1 2,3-bisphosphoglycerate-independent phosphoglycerate mutase [Candidatus Portnoybacteria bacterium]HPH52364.1 2,3-bisphosphoglycerate-independent phosphoglycerate mutase [Candidatus Portnoybacteria bacterium]HPM28658.1 2,3-bisphosphoglycerate-independent phosphoglycerate mutase [Candidatus Portnoybacteria bacterium]